MVKENDILEETKINKSQNHWKIGTWNKDKKAVTKDCFWDQITGTIEKSEDRLLILRDLNGGVGKKDEMNQEVQ